MRITKTIILLILTSICAFSRAQTVNAVALSLSIKFDSFYYSKNLYPIAILDVKNLGTTSIHINKKTILSPQPTRYSYFITEIEQMDSGGKKNSLDSNDVAPFRCHFDFFTDAVNDYTINKVEVSPAQHYTLENFIGCFEFEEGKNYRVRISIDKKKTGLEGTSAWIYFKMP